MLIRFFSEKIEFKIGNPRKVKSWLNDCAKKEKLEIAEIVYIFCSDAYLLKINQEYLNHNTFTDIVTFDYSEEKSISGEIYISIDRVSENAKKFECSFEQELHRVMVHGVLHLCGYKDKTTRAKSIMRKKEDACLSLWK